jgi:hypothetical protein
MAKKTTRQRKELAHQRAIQQAVANAGMPAARADAPVAAPAPVSSPAAIKARTETIEEHAYVRSDLRRIFILAAGITTVLIALSFLIQ